MAGRPTTVGAPAGNARQAIIDSAVACFHEKGFEATTVQEVVQRAQVTKGAFYHHFSSKDELLALIHDAFMDVQLRMIERVAAGEGGARDKLAELVEEIVVGAQRFQAEHAVFFEQRRFLSDERFGEALQKRDEFEQHLVTILEGGVAAGDFTAVASTRVLAFGVIGMASWTYQWIRPGRMSAREIGQMYAAVLLDGLGTG